MNSNNRKTSAAAPFFLGERSALIPTFWVSPCPPSPLLILPTSFLLPSSPPPLILTSHLPLTLLFFLCEPSPLSLISCVNPHPSLPLPLRAITPHSHFLGEPLLLIPSFCVSPHPSASLPVWILTLSLTLPTCPLLLIPTSCLSPQPSALIPTSRLSPQPSSPLPAWALSPHPHFLSEPSALIPTSCLSPSSHPHHLCKPSPLIHTCLSLHPLSPLACCSHWLVNEKWILSDSCEWVSWGSGKDKARCHILFLPKHWLKYISDHEAEWVSRSMVAQSDAVDPYLIDREISLEIIIFFLSSCE